VRTLALLGLGAMFVIALVILVRWTPENGEETVQWPVGETR